MYEGVRFEGLISDSGKCKGSPSAHCRNSNHGKMSKSDRFLTFCSAETNGFDTNSGQVIHTIHQTLTSASCAGENHTDRLTSGLADIRLQVLAYGIREMSRHRVICIFALLV